jgi:RNA polymerase sigma-70 factor (ECF subfamily)
MSTPEFNELIINNTTFLKPFAFTLTRDNESAKDLVQETFTKLWVKVEEVTFEKAKSYLFTAGYHTMIDMMRREKRKLDYAADAKLTQMGASERQYSDLQKVLNEALDTLPAIQKSVIMLRDYEGYSYEEIEEITGLNESQVKVYIYRARVALKAYIGKMENVI